MLAPRKNFREAVAAWQLAFAGDPNARLILKARFQLEDYAPDDPRIRVVDSNEPTRGISHWYQQADILLALGNEGFGLPLIEGMASGLPVVALASEAQRDVCEEATGVVLPVRPVRWEPVNNEPYGSCGVRAIPDVDDAARQLYWVAEHRQDARTMGQRASRWAHTAATSGIWDRRCLPCSSAGPEPPSRYGARTQCGHRFGTARPYGYYVADLTAALGHFHRYEEPPAAWRSRALHIQHAPGVITDLALAAEVQAAKQDGMAVVVTEHSVREETEAWEQRADVLVALSATAEVRLRKRWPNKRVEYIPRDVRHGAPPAGAMPTARSR